MVNKATVDYYNTDDRKISHTFTNKQIKSNSGSSSSALLSWRMICRVFVTRARGVWRRESFYSGGGPRCFAQVDVFPVSEGDIMTRGNILGTGCDWHIWVMYVAYVWVFREQDVIDGWGLFLSVVQRDEMWQLNMSKLKTIFTLATLCFFERLLPTVSKKNSISIKLTNKQSYLSFESKFKFVCSIVQLGRNYDNRLQN